jgi:hypothetical protein
MPLHHVSASPKKLREQPPGSSSERLRPIWIASYPRSGNTFLRILLQNSFRLVSYSLYRLEGQDHPDPSAEALEEAPPLPRDWRSRVSTAREATLTMIKTHGLPEDDAPAIYLVRDGRAAIHSYYHYHQKFAFEQPSLTEVIAGACQFGSWSDHVRAWKPRTRPNTLLLHYEDLVARPEEAIGAVAHFLERQPIPGPLPSFAELQQRSPAFFRRGVNQDFHTEWSPAQMRLFNQRHGVTMKEFGYELVQSEGPMDAAGIELAESATRLHACYLEQLTNAGLLTARQKELEQTVARLTREKNSLTAKLLRYEELWQRGWVRFGRKLGMFGRNGK